MFQNISEAKEFCSKNGIRMIDFKLTDLHGRWRHITIPVERFDEDIMTYGIGFDGSNYGYAMVENSDMVFIPDLSTAIVDPFVEMPTLAMIGDVMVIDNPNNRPFDQYPRNVVTRATEYMRSTGVADEMVIGPEYEFHIFDHVSYDVEPQNVSFALRSKESVWSSGDQGDNTGFHTPPHGGYHIDKPFDIAYDIRNRMCAELGRWGVDIKYHHHEVGGSGQVEIEVELGEVKRLADATMIAKYVIRNTAIQMGKTATLMPKPIYGEAGNGMHVHMLLKKEGKSLFYDPDSYSQLSQTAMYFIGGILTHVKALCAFTNPTTNSYKRLVPGFEAPVTVGFATANRSAVIRIPAYAKSPDKKRFELRCPDATCNPYYAFAAILMAGLDGIQRKIDPKDYNWGPFDFNLYNLSDEEKAQLSTLPTSLDEALNALEGDHEFLTSGGVFPKALITTWIKSKRAESGLINRIPHPKEFELYYDL